MDVADIESDQYLTFILSDEEFSMPVIKVKEIIEFGHLTNVPMVPNFIQGVVNLRGSVVPVINLAVKFGLDVKPIDKRTCIIIMETKIENDIIVMGVIVDKVLQVVEIPDSDIEPSPSLGTSIRTDFIKGMGKLDENFIVILDVVQVLSADEIALVGEIHNNDELLSSV